MADVHKLGTVADDEDRMRTARVDDILVRSAIDKTRKSIFQGNVPVGSSKIDKVLQFGSLVPLRVNIIP